MWIEKNKNTKRKKNRILYGVGVNDYDGFVRTNDVVAKSYSIWREMIRRCYGVFKENSCNAIYREKDCKVCDDWLYFSNFKRWFDQNHIDGYQLDKDILVKGNNVYSPNTCCFVPQELNKLLTKHNRKEGIILLGFQSFVMVMLHMLVSGTSIVDI